MPRSLFDTLPDSVLSLHQRGFPDHRIAKRINVPLSWVRRERKRLGLAPHPVGARLTSEEVVALLTKWDAFIYRYASGWCRKYPELDIEDVLSEARSGFWLAGERFDPRRGLTFMTYASAWMRNQVQRYAERELRYGLRVPQTAASRGRIRRYPVMQLPECRETGAVMDIPDDEHEVTFTDDVLDGLTETERAAVVLRFHDGRALKDVAEELGVTVTLADTIIGRAVEWMRRTCGVEMPCKN